MMRIQESYKSICDLNLDFRVLWIVFFLCIGNSSFAQKDSIWYDISWQETKRKSAAYYFRPPIQENEKGFLIRDYYINGNVQMEGVSSSATAQKWMGKVVWYHPNGQPQIIMHFSDQSVPLSQEDYYRNGQLKFKISLTARGKNGEFTSYHPNGKKAETGFFKDNHRSGNWAFFNTDGELVGKKTY